MSRLCFYCCGGLKLTVFSLINKIGLFSTVCPCYGNLNGCKAEFILGGYDLVYTMLWFGHSFVSENSIHGTGYSIFME